MSSSPSTALTTTTNQITSPISTVTGAANNNHAISNSLGFGSSGLYGNGTSLGGIGGVGMSRYGGMGGMGGMYGGGGYGSSMYGGGYGGSSMYGGGLGLGSSMYGGGLGGYGGMMGGMGGMYGGMGMMGMGGMGMGMGMGGMGMGMMGGMNGMMPPSEWEQRGHMIFMMLTRVLEALGMLSHVVQSLLNASLQFMASYVGLSHQYQQLTNQQQNSNNGNQQQQSPIFTDANNNQWLLLPPGIQQVLDENGQALEVVTIDDGRGNLIGAVPATPMNFQTLQKQNMLSVFSGNNNNNNNSNQGPPESTVTILLRVVKRLAILVIVIYLMRRVWKWYRTPVSAVVGKTIMNSKNTRFVSSGPQNSFAPAVSTMPLNGMPSDAALHPSWATEHQ